MHQKSQALDIIAEFFSSQYRLNFLTINEKVSTPIRYMANPEVPEYSITAEFKCGGPLSKSIEEQSKFSKDKWNSIRQGFGVITVILTISWGRTIPEDQISVRYHIIDKRGKPSTTQLYTVETVGDMDECLKDLLSYKPKDYA